MVPQLTSCYGPNLCTAVLDPSVRASSRPKLGRLQVVKSRADVRSLDNSRDVVPQFSGTVPVIGPGQSEPHSLLLILMIRRWFGTTALSRGESGLRGRAIRDRSA